jgi:hypothetical protein
VVTPFNSKAARCTTTSTLASTGCVDASRVVFFATEAGVFLYQCTPYLAWALIKLNHM